MNKPQSWGTPHLYRLANKYGLVHQTPQEPDGPQTMSWLLWNLYISFRRNVSDKLEIAAKLGFLYNINRCSHYSFFSGTSTLNVLPSPSTDSTVQSPPFFRAKS